MAVKLYRPPAPPPDPIKFAREFWPDNRFYKEQQEIIYSTVEDDETFVVAGNMLGKDYVAGFICLYTFLVYREVRVVTTSVRADHLRVLWGEIGRFVSTCKYPLDARKGGPLILNHWDIRKIRDGNLDTISYLRGMVSEKGEGMAGHHAEHTLGVIDEASGVDDVVYTQMGTWAKHILAFGNPNPTTNFFYKNIRAGNLLAEV
jgi:hypothetical protein